MNAQQERSLSAQVDRWVGLEIITPDQAGRIVAAETAGHPVGREHRSAPVVEGLGYVGGAIVVASGALISARYWDDVGTAWHLLLLGGLTVGLVLGGAAAPVTSGLGRRLRAVLHVGATGSAAGFLAVLAADPLDLADRDALVLVSCGTAALAVALWRAGRSPAQQLVMMLSLGLAAAALVARADIADSLPGAGVWAVGVIWALLGWRDRLAPSWFACSFGAATAIVGAMTTSSADAGTVLTLVTVLGVVAAGRRLRHLGLLGVGTLGLLVNLPRAITLWFPDSSAVPYVLLGVGCVMVAVAVGVARRRTS